VRQGKEATAKEEEDVKEIAACFYLTNISKGV